MIRLLRSLRSERGSALLIAIGAVLILTILSIGLISIAQNDLGLSKKDKKSTQALHVAEAGIDKAIWEMRRLGSISGSFQVATSLGTATVTASESGDVWNITSTGETNDGTRRVIKTEVFSLSYWNMVMASQSLTASGGGVNGTTSVDGPFYVRGSLELSGSSDITGGPLFVKDGLLDLQGNGTVGTPSEPIKLYLEQGYTGKTQNVYCSSLSYNVPNINLPSLGQGEMQDLEIDAKNQSLDNKKGYEDATADESTSYSRKYPGVGSGYYKVADDNSTVTTPLGSGGSSLVISSTTPSFGDPGTEAGPKDDLAWDLPTKTLTVKGTVFVDGPVTISTDIYYEGNGAIVANGDITLHKDVLAVDGTHTKFPATACLGFVTPVNIYLENPSNNSLTPNIEAALFAGQSVETDSNLCIKGALLTRNLEFGHPNGHLITADNLPDHLPEAMPGFGENLVIVSGWHEGKL
jgi:Tfp pilus assembly protein PilX